MTKNVAHTFKLSSCAGDLSTLTRQVNALLPNLAPGEAGEGRRSSGHGGKDGIKVAQVGVRIEGMEESEEDLQVIPRAAWSGDGLLKALQSPTAINHGAAFFSEAGAWQEIVRVDARAVFEQTAMNVQRNLLQRR